MAKKLYYKIGEACKLLEIQPYVLRYWETEFPALEPDKSKSGQRVYSEDDLALIGRIKELLYGEGFTIAGAKKKLEQEAATGGPARPRKAAQAAAEEKAVPAAAEAAETPQAEAPDRAAAKPEKKAKTAKKRKKKAAAKSSGPDPRDAEIARLKEAIREAVTELRALEKALTAPPDAG